jgi:phage shock protein C
VEARFIIREESAFLQLSPDDCVDILSRKKGEMKMNTQYKQLYRTRDGRMVGGVCAGLGKFFGIDPTLVRLLFVFAALVGWGAPVLLTYLVMLIVVPEEPTESHEVLSTPPVQTETE